MFNCHGSRILCGWGRDVVLEPLVSGGACSSRSLRSSILPGAFSILESSRLPSRDAYQRKTYSSELPTSRVFAFT